MALYKNTVRNKNKNKTRMAVKFELEEEFSSLDEFERKKSNYCLSNFVDLYRRDSRSVDNAKKRGTISSKLTTNHAFYEFRVYRSNDIYSCDDLQGFSTI